MFKLMGTHTIIAVVIGVIVNSCMSVLSLLVLLSLILSLLLLHCYSD